MLQRYIHSHVMYDATSDIIPLTWFKAAPFQKPKKRKLKRFPLTLAYATLIHFLQSFCQ